MPGPDGGDDHPPPLQVRIGLAALAAVSAELGVWAEFFPRSFYNSFPGGGHAWVSVDGPYNQHLVRDFGQYNLAFAVLLVVAAVIGHRQTRQAVLAAYLVVAVLHLIYHAAHLGPFKTSDAVANMFSLGLVVVLPIALLVGEPWLARRSITTTTGGR